MPGMLVLGHKGGGLVIGGGVGWVVGLGVGAGIEIGVGLANIGSGCTRGRGIRTGISVRA